MNTMLQGGLDLASNMKSCRETLTIQVIRVFVTTAR
jgi:hypothetical protein